MVVDEVSGEEARQLPRVVADETLVGVRVVKASRPCPKSKKYEERKSRSTACPPPPSAGENEGTDEERGLFSRPAPSVIGEINVVSDSSVESDASVRTAASGAAKRGKRGAAAKKKKTQRTEEPRARSSSDGEDPPTKRGRGRPPTTGEGVQIEAIKAAENRLKDLNNKIQVAEALAAGGYDPSAFQGRRRAKMALDLEEENHNLPSRDIAAQMQAAARLVDGVASKSGNLSGRFVRQLREAAIRIAAGADALAGRALPKENEEAREVERLRREVRDLREETERLRAEGGQRQMPPPPVDAMEVDGGGPPPPPPPRVVLPPRNEWPPAIRPAVQGRRRILSDGESGDETASAPPPPAPTREAKARDSGDIDAKLSAFAGVMREEVGRMLEVFARTFAERFAPPGFPNGARNNASVAPTPKGDAVRRPVPEREKGGSAKEKKKGGAKGSKPEARHPSTGGKDPPAGRKPTPAETAGPSTIKAAEGPAEKAPKEAAWSRVVGRKAAKRAAQAAKPKPPASSSAAGGSKSGVTGVRAGRGSRPQIGRAHV